jgi:hypothetical protein
VAQVSQAGAGYGADVTGTDDGDAHPNHCT